MDSADYLIVPFLQGFFWFDEGLQNYLRSKGWPAVTRAQSMVMTCLVRDITRPSDIARELGVSRQAVHITIGGMVEIGMVELLEDPADKRARVVEISEKGWRMREHARKAMGMMTRALAERVGPEKLAVVREVLATDWGPPLQSFDETTA